MSIPWPVADFDQVRRLRVLSAGISGARVAERLSPAPFEQVWGIAADLEREFGAFEPSMRQSSCDGLAAVRRPRPGAGSDSVLASTSTWNLAGAGCRAVS